MGEISPDFSVSEANREHPDLAVSQRRTSLLAARERGATSSQEYHDLVSAVRQDTLSKIPEYLVLQDHLQAPNEHAAEIASLVKKVRSEFYKDPIFGKGRVRFLSDPEAYEEYKREKLAEHQAEVVQQEETDKAVAAGIKKLAPHERPYDIVDLSFPDYPVNPQYSVDKLYHWVPNQLLQRVLQQGLLPGFLADDKTSIGRPVAHATFQRNEHWNVEMAEDRKNIKGVDYSDPSQYTLLEIDYDPSLEAYMWPPVLWRDIEANELHLDTDHIPTSYEHAPLLSTRVVPLDAQVSLLLDFDREKAESLEQQGLNTDRWVYSPILKRKLPPWAESTPESSSTSEVLLDYVPPSRIHVQRGV